MLITLFGAAFLISLPVLMLWYGFHKFKQRHNGAANQDQSAARKQNSVPLSGCFGLYIGAIMGFIAGFALPPVYYHLTKPEILNDGQWGMIYLATLPVGVVIGAIVGCITGVSLASRN